MGWVHATSIDVTTCQAMAALNGSLELNWSPTPDYIHIFNTVSYDLYCQRMRINMLISFFRSV